MEVKAKVSAGGKVTLPEEVRLRLGVRPGDEVLFIEDRNGIHLRRSIPDEVFDRWSGYLKDLAGRSSDEVVDELRGR